MADEGKTTDGAATGGDAQVTRVEFDELKGLLKEAAASSRDRFAERTALAAQVEELTKTVAGLKPGEADRAKKTGDETKPDSGAEAKAEVAKLRKELDDKDAAETARATRDKVLADKGAKLPEAYRKLVAADADAAVVEASLKSAADAYQADLAAAGVAPKDIGGAGTPAAGGAKELTDEEFKKLPRAEQDAHMAAQLEAARSAS